MSRATPKSKEPLYLSVSQRTSFKRCRWAWSWGYIRGLEPKTAAPALRFGLLIHRSLELYYQPGIKRGPKPWLTFEELYEEELRSQMAMGFRDDDGTWADAATLGDEMLRGYVEHYDGDKEFRVVASEQVFRLRVGSGVWAVGVIDGVWQNRSTKDFLMVDHKAVAQITTRQLVMDDQAGQYYSFGLPWLRKQRIIKPDDHFAYMMFNFLRKATPKADDRPMNEIGERLNKDGSVSKNQNPQAPLFVRHKTYRDEAAIASMTRRTMDEAEEIQMARRGELKLLKSPSRDNCGFCSVRDICELHDINQDWKMMARATLRRRDGSRVGQIQDAIDYERSR